MSAAWPATPKQRHDYWSGYLRQLADKMELRDWSVEFIDENPENENHAANAECRYGRKIINIRVHRGFFDAAPRKQRTVLVHELLHAHFNLPMQLIRDVAHNRTEAWMQVTELQHNRTMEHAIDAVADSLAPHLPLPPAFDPNREWHTWGAAYNAKQAKKKKRKEKAT